MRFDIAVLGAGRIGYSAAYDLSRQGYKLLALDISSESLEKVGSKLGIDTMKIDMEFKWVDDLRGSVETIVSALPGDISYSYVERLLMEGFNVIDATSIPEDRIEYLGKMCREKNVSAVLYAGVAPGMAQVLSGALYSELDGLDRLEIYVGGLPLEPWDKPLYTNITWNPLGFLRQYNRVSKKVVNGEVVGLDPFEDTGVIKLPGEDEYEYFLSNGLRSLLYTFKDVPDMGEYTLRYKGHLKQMRLLRELGFLDWEEIDIDGATVKPIYFTAKLLDRKLSRDPRDKVLLAVFGWSRGVKAVYYSYIKYDDELGLTGMQKATGFNLSRMAKMFIEGILKWRVTLPEYIGMDKDVFRKYYSEMEDAGIKIYRVEERV